MDPDRAKTDLSKNILHLCIGSEEPTCTRA